jgi:hypothetical protein
MKKWNSRVNQVFRLKTEDCQGNQFITSAFSLQPINLYQYNRGGENAA